MNCYRAPLQRKKQPDTYLWLISTTWKINFTPIASAIYFDENIKFSLALMFFPFLDIIRDKYFSTFHTPHSFFPFSGSILNTFLLFCFAGFSALFSILSFPSLPLRPHKGSSFPVLPTTTPLHNEEGRDSLMELCFSQLGQSVYITSQHEKLNSIGPR